MAPNTRGIIQHDDGFVVPPPDERIRCAILGCGMMGQEHISYICAGSDVRIDFISDPHEPSLAKAQKIMQKFQKASLAIPPTVFTDPDELLDRVQDIDLLVIASPNYLHTPTLLKWGRHDLTILVEKPVAVNLEQVQELRELSKDPAWHARLWVAMEYRYIPAISKLISLLPQVGDIKMVTIRENRYPFLSKIENWNRDKNKTGDTLVEKCCHFFDLFRLITNKEVALPEIRALAQRGLNYEDEENLENNEPIIDSAYVTMPFEGDTSGAGKWKNTIGCLELCMFAEGSRHQEEIIVTGTKGRLEAYMPENKVYMYQRPTRAAWKDRSVPPPRNSITSQVFDCSNVNEIHDGYHYGSTGVEWCHLIAEIKNYRKSGMFVARVTLEDGLRAVEIGLHATSALIATAAD